eukprot:1628129-Alexandrium_andersonii.AAC.1
MRAAPGAPRAPTRVFQVVGASSHMTPARHARAAPYLQLSQRVASRPRRPPTRRPPSANESNREFAGEA